MIQSSINAFGANAMAAQGSSYREILQHYYTGVAFAPLRAGDV